jgi:hypothetical protein
MIMYYTYVKVAGTILDYLIGFFFSIYLFLSAALKAYNLISICEPIVC